MYKCYSCGQKTLKFNKGESALYVNIIPDTNNRPNYKEQYSVVKILGNKCYAHFNFNSEGKATESKEKNHDYVCQPPNSKNTFPAHEDQLYHLERRQHHSQEPLDKEVDVAYTHYMGKLILGLLFLTACSKPNISKNKTEIQGMCDILCEKYVECSLTSEDNWGRCFTECIGTINASRVLDLDKMSEAEHNMLAMTCRHFNRLTQKGKE